MRKLMQSFFFAGVVLLTVQCRQEDSFYSNVLRSDVFYQSYEDRNYDFLWVFDNSASMVNRRKYVKDNMQSFLNILNSRKAIDYQMAVTTTDYFTQNGDLVANPGGLKVVKSASSANPVADFASIMDNVQDSPTSFWEQGLESAYQAVFKHRTDFSRTGNPLIMILLTDEEDWSCKDNCYGVEPEHNTTWIPWEISRYINYFSNVKSAENSIVAVFPIVGTTDTECTVASTGQRYMALQSAVGNYGVSGSICNGSLEASYLAIAHTIADRGVRFTLSKPASGKGISVYVNQVLIPFSPENYLYDAPSNSILFTGAIPKTGSIVEVAYSEQSN